MAGASGRPRPWVRTTSAKPNGVLIAPPPTDSGMLTPGRSPPPIAWRARSRRKRLEAGVPRWAMHHPTDDPLAGIGGSRDSWMDVHRLLVRRASSVGAARPAPTPGVRTRPGGDRHEVA